MMIDNLRHHMHQVAVLSRLLGSYYGLEENQLKLLEIAAEYHDVGKCDIDTRILNARRKLTAEEFAIVKTHSLRGAETLAKYKFDNAIVLAVKHHHEWWNGQGYPDGLKGEAIPLFSRIIAIADAYDTMVSGRVYKKSCSHNKALEELLAGSGTQFDPLLVSLFIELMDIKVNVSNKSPAKSRAFIV